MTQSELDSLLAEVIVQAKQGGIPVSRRICPTVGINRRAKTRFGCCRRDGSGYIIEISVSLLQAEKGIIRQVLAHEVLHTCPGCSDHGPRWKDWAVRMNRLYGYAIRRTDSHESLGLADDRPVRWLVVCRKCGNEAPRMRRSSLVQHPERYRCPCGGTLFVKEPETPH